MSRLSRAVLSAAGLAAGLLFFSAPAFARPAQITWAPEAPAQGDPLLIEVRPKGPAEAVTGRFMGKTLRFFPWGEGVFRAITPIPAGAGAGKKKLKIVLHQPGGGKVRDTRRVLVAARDFRESKLSVDPRFSSPPKEVHERIAAERAQIKEAWRDTEPRRLWRGPFSRPTETERTSEFGVRRTYNGRLKSRHNGLDLNGEIGEPIFAAAKGRVVLADDLYYTGRCVFIDHGLGFFTVYFHMSEVEVAPGDEVEAGQKIGAVGESGRVTGPHLHWGVKISGSYVDPERLLELPLSDDPIWELEEALSATEGGAQGEEAEVAPPTERVPADPAGAPAAAQEP